MKTIIIGAGLTGLIMARTLHRNAHPVVVLEKSKGLGGRMATRRFENDKMDHGAQFYNLTEALYDVHREWSELGLVHIWPQTEDSARYSAKHGMTSLAKALATEIPVLTDRKVVHVQYNSLEKLYTCICSDSTSFAASRVVLTAPLPQALELLNASQITYPDTLTTVPYAKAIVLLLRGTYGDLKTLGTDYCENISESIFSVSNQYKKGISSLPALTVCMTAAFSERHFESDDVAIMENAFREIKKSFPELQWASMELKKWRYSHPEIARREGFLEIQPEFYITGDAFSGGSLSGAAQSANALLRFFERTSSFY